DLLALACLPLLCAFAWVNLRYYARGSKFGVEASPAVSLLAVGRSFINLVAPARLAVVYDPARALNLLGRLLLPLFAWLAWKSIGQRAFLGLAFFAFPLLVVTLRTTNIFVSDTYLLLPGAGLGLVLAFAGVPARMPRAAGAAALLGLSLLSW